MKAILRLLQGFTLAEIILGIMGHTSAILSGVPCLYIGIAAFVTTLVFGHFCTLSMTKQDDALIKSAAAMYDHNLFEEIAEHPDSFTADERYEAFLSHLAVCFMNYDSSERRTDFLSYYVSNFNIKEFSICLAKLRKDLTNALRDPKRSSGLGISAAANIKALMQRKDIEEWFYFYFLGKTGITKRD